MRRSAAFGHRGGKRACAGRGLSCRRGRARAFSLVELLVVVGVVGLLTGLLIPTLSAARASAGDSVCLQNQRTLAAAWVAYTAKYDHFPTDGTAPNEDPPYGNRWGGEQAYNNPNGAETARVIHEILGIRDVIKHKFEVFRCPRDNSAVYANDNSPVWSQLPPAFLANYRNDDYQDSIFAMQGNSYGSNDWVWANVGSIDGAGPPSLQGRRWNHRLPLGAIINPGLTLMLGDVAALHSGPFTPEQQRMIPSWIGWWHGTNKCNAAFWDGSARKVNMRPGGYTNEYWLWLQPRMHPPEGTPVARINWVRNPPPTSE